MPRNLVHSDGLLGVSCDTAEGFIGHIAEMLGLPVEATYEEITETLRPLVARPTTLWKEPK